VTDITFNDYHARQLAMKLHAAIQTLEHYSLEGRLAHWERNAVERSVLMMLKDVKNELDLKLDKSDGEHDDIPF
jgi:hypothetical protein